MKELKDMSRDELCGVARKLLGAQLVRDNTFTPWGEDQAAATRAWRLGHKMLGTPGFEDVLEDGSRKPNDEPK